MPKKQYPLRLDAELYEVIERWANDEFRSVNAHIEFLLRDAAKRAGRLSKKQFMFTHKGEVPSRGED